MCKDCTFQVPATSIDILRELAQACTRAGRMRSQVL